MNDKPPSEIRPANRARDLDAPETFYVDVRRVACSGNGGALGHPRVWYSLDDGEAECGYCDRRFVFDPSRAGNGGSGAV